MRLSTGSSVRCKAPLRLGLAGGGTDLSPYCDDYGGAVLNCTIAKFALVSLSLSSSENVLLVSNDGGSRISVSLEQLRAGATVPRDLSLSAAVYRRIDAEFLLGQGPPLRIETSIDAPIGSGLGSSSALAVALIEAFVCAFDLPLGQYEVAHLAWEVERKDLALAGGKQDQYAAAFGGINFMEFTRDRVVVNPLRFSASTLFELEASLLIAYTGISRSSAEIIQDQVNSVQKPGSTALRGLNLLKEDAFALKGALLKWDRAAMAEILNRSWNYKKQTSSSMTSSSIDQIYLDALSAGALGGKISGAGGGGFMMFLVDPCDRERLRSRLRANGAQAEFVVLHPHPSQAWSVPVRAPSLF